MAANDDLPRGWVYTNIGSGGTPASVTIGAVPGIAHVLTAVTASVETYSAANQGAALNRVLLQGVELFPIITSGWQPITGNYGGEVDEGSWSGAIAYPQNTAVTIALEFPPTAVPNCTQIVEVQGYDI